MFVCLSVQNDLANRLTYMVLLYNVASRRSLGRFIAKEGKGGGIPPPSQKNRPKKKAFIITFLLKLKLKKGRGWSTVASMGVAAS